GRKPSSAWRLQPQPVAPLRAMSPSRKRKSLDPKTTAPLASHKRARTASARRAAPALAELAHALFDLVQRTVEIAEQRMRETRGRAFLVAAHDRSARLAQGIV